MNHLVVMAKVPQGGRVKTRLARDVGVAEAARVYRSIMGKTLQRLSGDPRWRTWIAVASDTSLASPVWPLNVSLIGQGRGNLGTRMQRVFDELLAGSVAIIGSDIPDIPTDSIAASFKALGHSDAVIGPAPDGGYWLIGQRRKPRVLQIFEDVRWSGEHAMKDTLANLKTVRVTTLEERNDVDTIEDYKIWRSTTG